MGIIRKAAIGSLLLSIGAVAAVKNKKPLAKMGKKVTRTAQKAMNYAVPKKVRRPAASKRPKKAKAESRG